MAPHSSTLAWKIPWTEEPGGLLSMGSLRVRHDWATSLSLFTFMHWKRKWQPTPVFLPGESQDGKAWWASVYGGAQSRTRLKRLSSSSSRQVCYINFLIPKFCLLLVQKFIPQPPKCMPKIRTHFSLPPRNQMPVCGHIENILTLFLYYHWLMICLWFT